ncbi:type II inositol-3,4-bisphosphate 4-phosphatase [Achlya hypogyna]|uniref:Type II inositol-3,4-bisphosphate 4-phosphatase n=1 Tax=Achlya hypogyna TaxID=1202772 RepID=A0A1V9YNG0_ACHHY|nr:type II inositol-3,4-bisphosphate 4-phosphatase [Achlya hypogyna]
MVDTTSRVRCASGSSVEALKAAHEPAKRRLSKTEVDAMPSSSLAKLKKLPSNQCDHEPAHSFGSSESFPVAEHNQDIFPSPSVKSIYSVAATSSTRPTRSSSFTDLETVSLNCSAFGKFRDQRFQTRPSSKMANFFRRRSLSKGASTTQPTTFTESDIHMSGYLSKRGSWRKNWKQRYFILRIDHPSLCYCDSETTLELVGQVPITPNTHVVDNSIGVQKAPFYFEVHTPRRVLYLGAATAQEHRKWIRSIRETIELVRSREQGENYVTQSSVVRPSPDATRTTASSVASFRLRPESLGSDFDDDDSEMRPNNHSSTGGIDGRYDLRLELVLDEEHDGAGFFVQLESLDAKTADWKSLGQTDVFRVSDDEPVDGRTYRHAFAALFELKTDKISEVRFSLFRATGSSEDLSFGKTPIAVGAIELGALLPYALVSCGGLDLDLVPPKAARSSLLSASRRNLLSQGLSSLRSSVQRSVTFEEDALMYLHLTAFAQEPSMRVGLPNTSHVVAHQKYVVPTALSAFGLVVDETLSVPDATFTVPLAFARYLRQELTARLAVLPSEKALLRDAYASMAADYDEVVGFLATAASTHTFRKSTLKKHHEWQFVATNLHMQAMAVHNGLERLGVYTTLTMGAPAAHGRGFASGGAARLLRALVDGLRDANAVQKRKSRSHASVGTFDLLQMPATLCPSPETSSKAYCPLTTTCKAWVDLEMRMHVVCAQILAAVAAHVDTMLELAAMGSAFHARALATVANVGLLMNFESLLSTHGNEAGMLEDFQAACKWLDHVTFVLDPAVASVAFETTPAREVGVRLRMPAHLAATVPPALAKGAPFRVVAVLFTQGINEMQSLAHAMRSATTQTQDEINHESYSRLKRHYVAYKAAGGPGATLESMWRAIETSVLHPTAHKKNVGLLVATSEFCRSIGGGRTTCCKSGKDRTAMSVTLEQARILTNDYKALNGRLVCETMRLCGVRRTNVYMNIHSEKFAFNELQRKLLPDCYKPPMGTYKSGRT